MKIAWRLIGLMAGAVFVYAGLAKVVDFQPLRFSDPSAFARDIDNYKMLPWQPAVWLALYLPWLEIFCGLALITRILHRGALFILTALMSVFIVVTVVAKARGLDISCGCFGHVSKNFTFTWHLVLDFAILAALVALWFPAHQRNPS